MEDIALATLPREMYPSDEEDAASDISQSTKSSADTLVVETKIKGQEAERSDKEEVYQKTLRKGKLLICESVKPKNPYALADWHATKPHFIFLAH